LDDHLLIEGAGYDQGMVSIILAMDQFLDQFPSMVGTHPHNDFRKGLLTVIIDLGAFLEP